MPVGYEKIKTTPIFKGTVIKTLGFIFLESFVFCRLQV